MMQFIKRKNITRTDIWGKKFNKKKKRKTSILLENNQPIP